MNEPNQTNELGNIVSFNRNSSVSQGQYVNNTTFNGIQGELRAKTLQILRNISILTVRQLKAIYNGDMEALVYGAGYRIDFGPNSYSIRINHKYRVVFTENEDGTISNVYVGNPHKN